MPRANDNQSISIEDAKETLGRSGYLLEDRIDTVLRSKLYNTAPNSTYPDPKTEESRELDVLADHWKFEERENARRAVNHLLIIECVNNPQPIAFMTKKRQTPLASIVKVSPIWNTARQDPETGEVSGGGMVMTEVLEMAKYHHYAQGRVATQFCTFQLKKGERGERQWMALHSDQDHGTFRKLADAVDYYSPGFDVSTKSVFLVYPILVVQGRLLEVHQEDGELKVQEVDHIAYTHSIYRAQRQGVKQVRYRIDVVTESYFPELLALMEKTREEVLRRLWELPELDSTDSTVEVAVETPDGVKAVP
jgi:hypothetical protein